MSQTHNGEIPLAVVSVIDTGTGIRADVLEKIWNPFFTTKPEGTGLGLPICRQIVQEHGGTIELQSELRVGTIVTVYFPGISGCSANSKSKLTTSYLSEHQHSNAVG